MFNQFTHVVAEASAWAYAVVALLALVDAVLPILPSETAVITAGVVAAATGALSLPLVIGFAAAGAVAGDNLAYGLGHRYGRRIVDRFFPSEKARRRIEWASRQLDRRGAELITVGRFLPAGRTAVTLAAGLTHFPWKKFLLFDIAAALIWAGYGALLGYFGGHAFEHQPWKGLLLAVSIAFAITIGNELVRLVLRRRRARPSAAERGT